MMIIVRVCHVRGNIHAFFLDDKKFGGTGVKNSKTISAEEVECEGKDYSIQMKLPPLSVTVYKFDYEKDTKKKIED